MPLVDDRHDMVIRKAAVKLGGSFVDMALQVVDAGVSTRKQLGQTRPSDTSATSIISPTTGEVYSIGTIVICNTSDSDVTYSIYHDDDGSTYDETTALFWEATIRANSSDAISLFMAMDDPDGNLAVQSSVGNALTFTAYGAIFI